MKPASLGPGAVLAGRFRLTELCGAGAMAEVWAAQDLSANGYEVALKVHAEIDDPDQLARFEREARAVARIDSPYVCRLFDVARGDDGAPLLILELLRGETLAARIVRERVLALASVESLLGQLLAGLEAAHAVGVIHRDLKPSNVFLALGADGIVRCKLLDFGVSKIVAADPTGWEPALTTEHTTLGSLSFMAPEQIGGSAGVDARADVYAAGVVAFRALTGRLPFEAPSLQAVMALKADQEPPTLDEATRMSWPPPLVSFFRGILARDPRDRFPSAVAAASAWGAACAAVRGYALPPLADLAAGAIEEAPQDTQTLPGPRGRRR